MDTEVSPTWQSIPSAADSGSGYFPKFKRVEHALASETLAALVREEDSNHLDYDALNVFFRIGTFIGTDSPYRDIKADPPDYKWATSRPVIQESRPWITASYIDLFRQSIKRCDSRDQAASLGLSGGRDSRHILFELLRSGRAPARCWTVDLPSKPNEASIAKQLCERLGVAHSLVHLSRRYADLEVAKDRITSFSSLQHAWLAEAVLDGVAASPVLFDGIGGDVLSAGLFLTKQRVNFLAENRIDELVEDIVGRNQLLMFRDPSLFPLQRALEKVNEEFRKHLGAPDPISSFYFWNRTRRDIGCAAFALLRQNQETVFAPYLDPDLCSFLAGLPPAITSDHQLHTQVIAKAYPEYADIPYAEKSAKALTHYRKIAADMLRYVLTNSSPLIDRQRVFLQLFRALISSSHTADVLYLGPSVVYATELCKI